MDRLLFGDNQFFGVNHMSEEKARAQAMRFQDLDAVIDVLDAAYDEGIRTFMCTTHDRIARGLRPRPRQPGALPRLRLLPLHAVRAQVRQRGHRGRDARRAASGSCPTRASSTPRCAAAARWRRKDIEGIDDAADRRRDEDVRRAATRRSSSCRTSSSTCCSASASRTPSAIFADHVRERYDAEPGFITMNLPTLLDVLDEVGHREPDRLLQHQQDRLPHVRRASRPTRRRCASASFRAIAMSVFASGAIPPRRGDRVGLRAARTSSRSSSAPRARANIRSTRGARRRVLAALTTLLVASTGGHLKQLHQLHRRLTRRRRPVPLGHLRHPAEPLAAGRRGGRVRPLRRRPRPAATSPATCPRRTADPARRTRSTRWSAPARRSRCRSSRSAGRRGLRCHYIESAARIDGPVADRAR